MVVLNSEKPICGCKGIRFCKLCETNKGQKLSHVIELSAAEGRWLFCNLCEQFLLYEEGFLKSRLSISGVKVISNVVNQLGENDLLKHIEQYDWITSQSGRKKQDIGPRINFKKRKLNLDCFHGFPQYYSLVKGYLDSVKLLNDFLPVELCNLEYTPDRGSSIDPHFDDFWVWGERLVTLNLLSDTVLTLSNPEDQGSFQGDGLPPADSSISLFETYNLNYAAELCRHLENENVDEVLCELPSKHLAHILMPRGSMVIISGEARKKYHHSVLRQDVKDRRIAMTLRELSQEVASSEIGKQLLDKAVINPSL